MVTLRFKSRNSPTVIISDDEANVEMNDFAKFDDNNNVLEKKGNLGYCSWEVTLHRFFRNLPIVKLQRIPGRCLQHAQN